MWGRLLTKAAVLLAAWMGQVAMANEPGTETEQTAKTAATSPAGASSAEKRSDLTHPAQSAGKPSRNPRVVIITSNDSESCRRELERLRRPRGDFEVLQAQGWKIGPQADNHIQLVDKADVPDLIRQLAPDKFPVVACIQNGEIVRSFKDGCSTPLDVWTFGWLLKGKNERPQALIPEPIRVATTGHYPLRGNHWTVDGDTNPTKERLVSHLRGPNHVNSLNAAWTIEEWSLEELRSLHDDIHEREGGGVSAYVARPQSSTSSFAASNKALGKYGR